MTDIAHVFGQDLQVGSTGDLATVTGSDETQQRVLHRLMTNPGAYIWNLDYGAGLPALVGAVIDPPSVGAAIVGQMLLESEVASIPAPTVSVATDNVSSQIASVTYTDASTGEAQTLTLGPS